MANYRIPRGYARRHSAYQEIMEGIRPTIKGLTAAPWLPIASVEPRQDDPIVIPAGTWVGIYTPNCIMTTGAAQAASYLFPYYSGSLAGTSAPKAAAGMALESYLVPACSAAYHITYTATDYDTTFFTPGVLDFDHLADTTATVTQAKTTALVVGESGTYTGSFGIKPIGIVYNDIYASWLSTTYLNYERQPNIGLLMKNQVIQVPCVTSEELLIQPGDVVYVAGQNVTTEVNRVWDPTYASVTAADMTVGHLVSHRRFVAAGPAGGYGLAANGVDFHGWNPSIMFGMTEHKVGRCIRKIKIASGATSQAQNTALSAAIPTARTSVNVEWQHASRVQTVPGLGLQGSGTMGIPGHLLSARSDVDGNWWALEIAVDTY